MKTSARRSVGRLALRCAPLSHARAAATFVSLTTCVRNPPRARHPLRATLTLARLGARRSEELSSPCTLRTRPTSAASFGLHGTYVEHAPGPSQAVAARVRILRDFSLRDAATYRLSPRRVASRRPLPGTRNTVDIATFRVQTTTGSSGSKLSSISYPARLG